MAKPIKETPVLKGKDAQNFKNKITCSAKLSTEARSSIRRDFDVLNSFAKF